VRRVVTALTVGLLLAGAVGASAQIFVAQSLGRYYRVEWRVTRDRKSPAVEGYVYNTAGRTAERMRLQIDRVDASGSVIGNSIIWLPGDLHRNDRAFFSSSVPESASYRVQVLSFDWGCDGGGGGM